jgi:hypothetical protein
VYEYALTPDLWVSFQRYPSPQSGIITAAPTSWGALPLVAVSSERLALACPDREAFWIGLVTSRGSPSTTVHVRALLADERWIDPAGTISVPPTHPVPGIARGDGTAWAFARDPAAALAPVCRTVELAATTDLSGRTVAVHVDVVDVPAFIDLGGRTPDPLGGGGHYDGRRLP